MQLLLPSCLGAEIIRKLSGTKEHFPAIAPGRRLAPPSPFLSIESRHTERLKLPGLRLRGLDRRTSHTIREKIANMKLEMLSLVLRLDCLSCVLTVFSTILVGRRCWEGWVLAAANSLIICVIGLRTAQLGFIPANLFCIVLYAVNLRTWRKAEIS